jgi:hypothetical protein
VNQRRRFSSCPSRPLRPGSTLLLLLFLLAMLAVAPAARAARQEPEGQAEPPAEPLRLRVPRAESPIRVDALLDEEAWNQALRFDLDVEIGPGKNVPAPVKTVAWLTYDDDYVYAAFRAEDPEPHKIRARLADRDTPFRDDFVGFVFDTFDDQRRGFEFFVNPLGVQMDLAIDENSDNKEDSSWDAIWESAGRIGETGFVVEMAIPFSSLRFQRTGGEQTWAVIPFRSYPRSQRHQITAFPIDPDGTCFICEGAKVTGFEGATPGRNLELAPTLTAQRTDRREEFPAGSLEDGDVDSDVGLTARWGITPNLVFSGAANPDFSQVEADVAQLDVNNQFALFFPEKRPFFLEGADFFSTPFNIVHTRTVADPSWGVKLTGKEGRQGMGVFVAQDERTNLLLPGSQFSRSATLDEETTDAVLRYRLDVGGRSTLGALATLREGREYSNGVYGVDGVYRPTPSDSVSAQFLGSRTEYPLETAGGQELPQGTLDGTAYRLAYNHNSRHWGWYGRYEDIDPEFRADLGFMPRVGYSLLLGGLERVWWSEGRRWWTAIALGGDWDRTEQADGIVLEEEMEAWVNVRGPYQSFFRLQHGRRDRYWNGVTFDEQFVFAILEMQPAGWFSFFVEGTIGDTIDFANTRPADLVRVEGDATIDLGRRLRMSLGHELQRIDVDGGRLIEANLSQLRAVYQLNVRTFVRAILQYADVEQNAELFDDPGSVDPDAERLFSQFLFSYKLNPQTVVFLGYSDNSTGGELVDTGRIDLTRSDRTFFAKVGYALVL